MSVEQLKNELKKGEAFLIVSSENRRYLTDFAADDDYLFVTKEKCVFLADSRYIEAAKNEAKNCDEIILLKKASEQLPELAEKFNIDKIYTEAQKLSVEEYNFLKKMFSCPVLAEKADEIIISLRRAKKEYEKQRIIAAQRIAEKAFDHILTFIRPGVTEKDIRLELEFFMLKNGAEGLSFDTIAVSGKNTSKPHGVPSLKKIENGDFITMDYGAVVNGYRSDMTRTVAVGSVSTKQAQVYETVLKAQLACLDVLKAGVSGKDADAAARQIIADAGYGDYFGHGTGHGVGIDIHEAPSVSVRSKDILTAGDIVTDEPGIYIPGEFGVRIEDMAFITENGCENLTNCEKSLIVL